MPRCRILLALLICGCSGGQHGSDIAGAGDATDQERRVIREYLEHNHPVKPKVEFLGRMEVRDHENGKPVTLIRVRYDAATPKRPGRAGTPITTPTSMRDVNVPNTVEPPDGSDDVIFTMRDGKILFDLYGGWPVHFHNDAGDRWQDEVRKAREWKEWMKKNTTR